MKFYKKASVLAALILLTAVLFTGCSKEDASSASAKDFGDGNGAKVLKIAMDSEPKSMNPVLASGGGNSVINNAIYGCVWTITCDGETNFQIAESYEYTNDEKTEMVIKLREDSKWEDGTPITPEDILFSYEYYKEGPAAFRVMNIDFENCAAIDEHTLKIKIHRPWPTFHEDLALMHIISRDLFDEGGVDAIGLNPKASGAYKIKSWSPGKPIVLEKNPNYFEKDKLEFDEVEVICLPDETTRMLEFESGSYDVVYLTARDNIEKISKGNVKGTHIQYGNIQQVTYIVVNTIDFEKFQNLNIRRAIAHAVDWKTIVEVICGDGYTMQTSPLFPSANWAYKNEGVYEYNPELAKRYLADAGYGPNEFLFTMRISNEDFNSQIAESMQAYLAEAGIRMNVSLGDTPTVREENRNNTIEMSFSKSMGAEDPSGVVNARMSNAKPNITKFGDPAIQADFDAACTSSAPKEERKKVFQDLQDRIWEWTSTYPLYESKVCFGAKDSIGAFDGGIDASSGYLHLAKFYTGLAK